MSKWIEFKGPYPLPGGKTRLWDVFPKDGGRRIGQVRWYAPWRKYTFAPDPSCVFEQDCLRDIAAFIENETKKHKRLVLRTHRQRAVKKETGLLMRHELALATREGQQLGREQVAMGHHVQTDR